VKVEPWPTLLLHGNSAAVGFDDGFDEAEAKAEPALGAAAVAAKEAFPNAGDFLPAECPCRYR
jgi:hypothetical protein